jgi:hypothetical protein
MRFGEVHSGQLILGPIERVLARCSRLASVFLAQPSGKSNCPVFSLRRMMVWASCLRGSIAGASCSGHDPSSGRTSPSTSPSPKLSPDLGNDRAWATSPQSTDADPGVRWMSPSGCSTLPPVVGGHELSAESPAARRSPPSPRAASSPEHRMAHPDSSSTSGPSG